jgi:hypothetical protein
MTPADDHHDEEVRIVLGRTPPAEQVIEHVRVRQRHGRPAPRAALSMTPMIDVVFLLLIYFLVATDFRLGEQIYRMDLPARPPVNGQSQQDPFKLDEEPLRITVASTGLGPDMYRLRIDGPYPQPGTFEALYEFLRDKQVNPTNLGVGAMFQPNHPVIIQPTRSTRWDHAMEAFNAAARARYTNVTFAKPP